MSSIRNDLGLNAVPETVRDKTAQGAGELMVSVRKTYKDPLTEDYECTKHHFTDEKPCKTLTLLHTRCVGPDNGAAFTETIKIIIHEVNARSDHAVLELSEAFS